MNSPISHNGNSPHIFNHDVTIAGNLTIEGNLNFGDAATDVLTVAGYIQGSASGKNFVAIGDVSSSHSLSATNDLVVGGQLEVDDKAWFDGFVEHYGNTRWQDNNFVYFGTSGDAGFKYSTTQTPDALILGLGANSNGFIISEMADTGTDFGHALQTNPTLFIQSADATDTTQWISFAHDQTDGVIDVGTGSIKMNAAVIFTGTTTYSDGIKALFGSSADAEIVYETAQTPDALMIGVGLDSNGLIITKRANSGIDHGHAQQTNPTIFIHSNTAAADEWISLSHNQSNGVIAVGTGNITMNNSVRFQGNATIGDAAWFEYGNDSDAGFMYSTWQTPDSLFLGLSTDSNSLIIGEKADVTFDFAHAQQTNPTIFIHSANQATDEWGSFAHNQTDFVIASGKGSIKLLNNLIVPDGAVSSPSLGFNDDTDTGFYRTGSGEVSYTSNGSRSIIFGAYKLETNSIGPATASTLSMLSYLNLYITDTDSTTEGDIWYDASEDKLKFRTAAAVETITSA